MSESGPTPQAGSQRAVDASLYLHPQTLARLDTFELRAKLIVEGVMSGQHRSPYQGFSVEFAQHRPYSPGDDIRHLDWKVYGRTDKLQLKQYQQETNLDLICLVDASGSMNFGSRSFKEASGAGLERSLDGRLEWTKFDHATALAAAVSYITLHQGDRVGLGVFAEGLASLVGRSSRRGTWRKIVETLSTHTVDQPTNIARVIDQTLGQLGNRCLIVMISDFFEDIEKIRAALARVRHRGHDLILFQIVDEAERTLAVDLPAVFEGLEGEPPLRVDPRAVRDDYRRAFEAHTQALQRLVRSFGFDHAVVNTHDWLGPPLAAFIARRTARMKRTKFG
ncbi:MAG: DUF58 domain-containing protein [Phycisphaeraceae bacterium]|nr:MAG: DUF58 domain-containing protein [Phycisphaeraceae bacterium]